MKILKSKDLKDAHKVKEWLHDLRIKLGRKVDCSGTRCNACKFFQGGICLIIEISDMIADVEGDL